MLLHRIECNFTVSEMMFILMGVLSRLFYRYPPVLHPVKTSCAFILCHFQLWLWWFKHTAWFSLLSWLFIPMLLFIVWMLFYLKCPNSNSHLLQNSLLLFKYLDVVNLWNMQFQSVFAGARFQPYWSGKPVIVWWSSFMDMW